MVSSLLPAFLSAGGLIAAGSVASSAISATASAVSNRNAQLRQYQQSQELMDKQNQLNIEQWQRETEWASPANQLKLKEEAGLNPLFGEGSTSVPSSQGVSLPSVSPAASVDYGGIFQSVFENLFKLKDTNINQQNADSTTRVSEAKVKETDALIVNSTNSTNSQMRVDAARVQELLSRKDLNDEQKAYVHQQTEASKAMVEQKWKELQIATETVAAKYREIANQEYTSRWQEKVGFMNARSSQLAAQSSKMQAVTANAAFNFGVRKFSAEYAMEVAKYSKQLTNENIDKFLDVWNSSKMDFGIVRNIPIMATRLNAFCESFVNNQNKLSVESFNKVLPYFLDSIDQLELIEINSFLSPMQPKKKRYNPAPWFPDEM